VHAFMILATLARLARWAGELKALLLFCRVLSSSTVASYRALIKLGVVLGVLGALF